MTIDQLKSQIEKLNNQLEAEATIDLSTKSKYLGKKGLFNALAKEIKNVDNNDKKEAGQLLNELK